MSKPRLQADFLELRILRREGGDFARLEHPDCEAEVALELDDLAAKLGGLVADQLRLRQLVPPGESTPSVLRECADEVGRELARRLFREPIASCFERRRQAAKAHGRRLVLRLRFDSDPRLLAFPWEVLFGPGGRKPLAVNDETPLVRTLALPQPVSYPPAHGRLRVLMVAAQPAEFAPLDSAAEMSKLTTALAAGAGRRPSLVRALHRATPPALEQAVKEFCPQVVHFIGHGATRSEGGEPCVALESEQGAAERVDGQQLAALLGLTSSPQQAPPLRLVVLNACSTAEPRLADALAGVAQRLVQQGLSAVVAMRYPITDSAAIDFAERLYQELAAGRAVEQAVSRARHTLYSRFSDLSWLAPVLFLRGEVGRLVRPRSRFGRLAVSAGGVVLLGSLALWLDTRQPTPPPRPLPPEVLVDDSRCPSPPGLTLGLRYIPSGSFEMGTDRSINAAPKHRVTLTEAFCLAKTELTVGHWRALQAGAVSRQGLLSAPEDESSWLPQGGFSYEKAVEVIRRLNDLAGAYVFFLPTEAQWEYAARAGSVGGYSFGDDTTLLPLHANCGSGNPDGFDGPARVASFRPNDWQLFDMQGNLTEWVRDWYASYGSAAVTDPKGPGPRVEKVRRGGSYGSAIDNCGVETRATATVGIGRSEYGLRVARRPLPPP